MSQPDTESRAVSTKDKAYLVRWGENGESLGLILAGNPIQAVRTTRSFLPYELSDTVVVSGTLQTKVKTAQEDGGLVEL